MNICCFSFTYIVHGYVTLFWRMGVG